MKNKDQGPGLYKNNLQPGKNLYLNPNKTTNINILLNRVRLDKKKSIRKKMIITAIFSSVVSGFIAYLLI